MEGKRRKGDRVRVRERKEKVERVGWVFSYLVVQFKRRL